MIDVVFSFDTTGSMSPCIAEVRRRVADTVKTLFGDLPDLHIGIIAHGDYCDAGRSYVTAPLDLTDNREDITGFVRTVGNTGGGDAPECYELVLHEVRDFAWREYAKKVLVMIGDATPHSKGERQNYLHLDWKEEARALAGDGIEIYSIQCLSRGRKNTFWKDLSKFTPNGKHINLKQFADIVELIHAVCYKQESNERLLEYEDKLITGGLRFNRNIAAFLDKLLEREASSGDVVFGTSDLESVPDGRFQIVSVDARMGIRDLVELIGAEFKVGRGFYQHTKRETVQERKEVVLVHNASGDMFTGKKAREMIGLPYNKRGNIRPAFLPDYDVFIQSTSWNRILISGTKFLYEVAGWD